MPKPLPLNPDDCRDLVSQPRWRDKVQDSAGCIDRAEKAEATIQRVRDVCERGHYAPDTLSEWQRGFLTARREVRAILDGDGDE